MVGPIYDIGMRAGRGENLPTPPLVFQKFYCKDYSKPIEVVKVSDAVVMVDYTARMSLRRQASYLQSRRLQPRGFTTCARIAEHNLYFLDAMIWPILH